jgi:hypothetical protein
VRVKKRRSNDTSKRTLDERLLIGGEKKGNPCKFPDPFIKDLDSSRGSISSDQANLFSTKELAGRTIRVFEERRLQSVIVWSSCCYTSLLIATHFVRVLPVGERLPARPVSIAPSIGSIARVSP